MPARIHIGTSGWQYRHGLGRFYRSNLLVSRMFEYYQQYFDTVELNNTFYQLPTPETFAAWRDAAPPNFLFAVKGSRFLRHNKKLKEPEQALQKLLPRAEILGKKLGPVLFQLPPRWRVNVERHSCKPYRLITGTLSNSARRSCHIDAVYETLRYHNAAYCIHELAGFHTPIVVTANFSYVRCTARAVSIKDATQSKACGNGRWGALLPGSRYSTPSIFTSIMMIQVTPRAMPFSCGNSSRRTQPERLVVPLKVPWLKPEDLAPAAVFLASDLAATVTDGCYDVSGGDDANLS